MTELRNKMIKSMELRNLSTNTQRAYLAAVSGLAKHYNKSPDKISKDIPPHMTNNLCIRLCERQVNAFREEGPYESFRTSIIPPPRSLVGVGGH